MGTPRLADDDFDVDLFEARLEALKDTQDGIQQMSQWCLSQRTSHKKIVACWLRVLRRVNVEQRLTLFYLANDVIQYSKRKKYEYVDSWATALQRATTMVRDDKVKGKILRIFKIWEQREVYTDEYIGDLRGLLNIHPPKKTIINTDADDFQNSGLVGCIKECVDLSNATDKSFNKMPKQRYNDENVIQQLKEKYQADDVIKDVERYITYCEAYIKNLNAEIKGRKCVLENLSAAMKFYTHQRGEVKVVVTAYKNFGSRIKLVKKKLEELIPSLPSPIPSPDINAPSPERDADLQLPDEQSPISINLFKNSNGYSGYMDGNLPFDINDFKRDSNTHNSSSQPIEVIGSRSDDESYSSSSEYYNPASNSILPNLVGPAAVSARENDYSAMTRSAHYNSEYSSHITTYIGNNSYNNNTPLMPPPPLPVPSVALTGSVNNIEAPQANNSDTFNSPWEMNMPWPGSINATNSVETPHSPPHYDRQGHGILESAPLEYNEAHANNLLATQDVDHRQIQLPPAFTMANTLKDKVRLQDVDHRNLISLTGSPSASETEKKSSWLSGHMEKVTGDIDYRQAIKTIDTSGNVEIPLLSGMSSPPFNSAGRTKKSSPHKSNTSSSSESQKDDTTGSYYEPTDMVVDMDMSDEDIDEFLKEVSSITKDHESVNDISNEQYEDENQMNKSMNSIHDASAEYVPQQTWDSATMQPMNIPPYQASVNVNAGTQQPPPPPPPVNNQEWNQLNWNSNGVGGGPGIVPPPPRPPFPMQSYPPYVAGGQPSGNPPPGMTPNDFNNPTEGNEYYTSHGRGRGRGWSGNNHPYRPSYPRPPRGASGSPYYSRGGRGVMGGSPSMPSPGGIRGGFRGKYRGSSNPWL